MGNRILLVEDDPDLHIGLALRLKSVGHAVCSALDGREVLSTVQRERPDVIIMDVGLPGRSGHEVAQDLSTNDETRHIPIIYLTARHELDHRLKAAERGAAAYLVKPTSPEQLFAAIDAAVIAGKMRLET